MLVQRRDQRDKAVRKARDLRGAHIVEVLEVDDGLKGRAGRMDVRPAQQALLDDSHEASARLRAPLRSSAGGKPVTGGVETAVTARRASRNASGAACSPSMS